MSNDKEYQPKRNDISTLFRLHRSRWIDQSHLYYIPRYCDLKKKKILYSDPLEKKCGLR